MTPRNRPKIRGWDWVEKGGGVFGLDKLGMKPTFSPPFDWERV